MNEVDFHRKTASRHPVFARRVKMELKGLVTLRAQSDVAALAVICLYGVPVIDQLDQRYLVVEAERFKLAYFSLFDIDRRLPMAGRTGFEGGLDRSPFGGGRPYRNIPSEPFGMSAVKGMIWPISFWAVL